MQTIAVAISLTHQGFGAIVLAFHKPIGKAHGQKLKKGENFVSPILEGRQGFSQGIWTVLFHLLNPSIQFHGCGGGTGCGVPGA